MKKETENKDVNKLLDVEAFEAINGKKKRDSSAPSLVSRVDNQHQRKRLRSSMKAISFRGCISTKEVDTNMP